VADSLGIEVVTTKLAPSAVMAAAGEEGVVLAASLDGGLALPRFLPAFDAMAALVTMLELMARTGTRLSKLVATLPRTYVTHETVSTPSEQKGALMRGLVEASLGELVLVDGVKVLHADGWALVLPDPELSVTHVWAEGASDGEARRRALDYVGRIRRLLR
jgi:mannose-1-phosphate guanylyltransferase/phosphomannomutase